MFRIRSVKKSEQLEVSRLDFKWRFASSLSHFAVFFIHLKRTLYEWLNSLIDKQIMLKIIMLNNSFWTVSSTVSVLKAKWKCSWFKHFLICIPSFPNRRKSLFDSWFSKRRGFIYKVIKRGTKTVRISYIGAQIILKLSLPVLQYLW